MIIELVSAWISADEAWKKKGLSCHHYQEWELAEGNFEYYLRACTIDGKLANTGVRLGGLQAKTSLWMGGKQQAKHY